MELQSQYSRYLRLHVANACNQQFMYYHVFTEKKQNTNPSFMSFETAKRALEGYTRHCDSVRSRLTVSLYGGEPLLNWKMLTRLFEFCDHLGEQWAGIDWVLNTNGTLITKKIAETLCRFKVDVHISLDGCDEKSNKHRVFRNNTLSFNRIMRGLERLHQAGCRIQFDTCLTETSIGNLQGLIDLAANYGVDRIYASLTDTYNRQMDGSFDMAVAAEMIARMIPYSRGKGVDLRGPWKRAIEGGSDFKFQTQNLHVDTRGTVCMTPFMSFPLGDVSDMDKILTNETWTGLKAAWKASIKQECEMCTLGNNCGGYLREMVLYHTGKDPKFSRECQFSLGILNTLSGFPPLEGPENWNEKLMLSKHLMVKSTTGGDFIVHGLRGTTIRNSDDLMKLLQQCRPETVVKKIWGKYSGSPDTRYALHRLLELKFLIDPNLDEEISWLDEKMGSKKFRSFATKHFIVQHSKEHSTLVHHFVCVLEDAWSRLSSQMLPEPKRPALVLLASSREQFHTFWGEQQALPDWPKAFIIAGRVLVADAEKLNNANIGSVSFLQGMMHELVHIWLHDLGCHLPVWMEEGLCEYFSRPYDESRFAEISKAKGIFGFREMEALVRYNLLDLDQSNIRENICYHQSHSFVDYLVRSCGEKEFIHYIHSVGLGDDHRKKFLQLFDSSLDEFENRWADAYDADSPKQLLLPAEHLCALQKNGKVLLYNSRSGENIVANDNVLQFIDLFKNGISLNEINKKIEIHRERTVIRELYWRDLLGFGGNAAKLPPPYSRLCENIDCGSLINKLRLNVATLCNLSCSYCYLPQLPGTPSLMTWSVARRSIDSFMELLVKNCHDTGMIRFFGGEPMLNWEVTKGSIEYADAAKGFLSMAYVLNTNGTVVDEDIAKFLAQYQVTVLVSVDGEGSVHDQLRPFKVGKGSFEVIDSSLRLLLSADCKVGLETTLSSHNCDHLNELIDYVSRLKKETGKDVQVGFQKICMVPENSSEEVVEKVLADKLFSAMRYAWSKGVDVDNGMVNIPFNALIGRRRKRIYCGGQGDELCVYPNGDIYPCGAIPTRLGSIEDLDAVFQSNGYQQLVKRYAGNIPGCQDCDIEAFCSGGCAADAVTKSGELFNPSGHCQLERNTFKFLVEERLLW
jgi:uncharacterized protein